MNWLFFALLSPAIYTVNIFVDKYLLQAKIPDYRGLPIFTSILALVVSLLLWTLGGFKLIDLKDTLLVIITGICTVWAFSLYLEALMKEETSVVIILIQLVPVIVLLLSYLFLKEPITSKQLIGFIILLIASTGIALKQENLSFKFSSALLFITLADMLWAFPYVLIKFASHSISFPNLILYEGVGIVFGGIFLFVFISNIRQAFLKTIKTVKKPVLSLVFLNECIFLLGKTLTYLAVTLGPAALVSILGSTQIFFGIIFGIILALTMPKIFKEDLSKKALTKKALLGILAFTGIILVG